MKKIHILSIIVIAVSIGALIATLGNTSKYSDFTEATQNPETEYHVVGKLNKEKPREYNVKINKDIATFYMFDNNGIERKVVLHDVLKKEIENAEQIVIIGKMEGQEFHANEILMKCPSKYNDGKQEIASN